MLLHFRYLVFFVVLLFPLTVLSQTALDDLKAGANAISKQNGPEALKLLKRSLAKVEQGEEISKAKLLELKLTLATAYLLTGDMSNAENISLSILPEVKRKDGERSLSYAAVIEMVALANQLSGQYIKSLEYYEKLVELHASLPAIEPAYRARVLSTKSIAHKELGQFIKAIESEEAALTVLRELSPGGSDAIINSLVQLAYLAGQLGDFEAQLKYLQNQYETSLALYGAENESTRQIKDWLEARQEERKKSLSGDDANALGNFTLNVVNVGSIGFPADEVKNLAKAVKQYGKQHPLTLSAIGKYADSLATWGEPNKAIAYYNKAIEIHKQLFSKENADLASLHLRLSSAHSNIFTGDSWKTHHPKAIENAKMALDIYSSLYGDAHLRTIVSLNHYWQLNRFQQARQKDSFLLALRIWKAYTELEQRMLPYMSRQQRVGFRQNFVGLQDNFLEAAWVIYRKMLQDNAIGKSEYWDQSVKDTVELKKAKTWEETQALLDKQNKAYEAARKKDAENENKRDKETQKTISSLYDEWINYKGSISAVENSLNIARLNTANKEHIHLIEKLLDLRKIMANLRSESGADSATRLDAMQLEASAIKKKLYVEIPSLRSDSRFRTADLVKSLTKNSVFIDFARYSGREYMAFIVEPTGKVHIRRLTGGLEGGDEINIAIRKIRSRIDDIIDGEIAIAGSEKKLLRDLHKLYEGIILPMDDILKSYDTIISSPDGLLALLPLGLLNDKKSGKYLVERFNIQNVPSAREWLRLNGSVRRQSRSSSPVVYANPDFNSGSSHIPKQCASQHPNRSVRNVLMKTFKDDCISSLPATADEAKTIQSLLGNVRIFTEVAANEQTLLKEASPRILHLATHGFFIPDPAITNPLEKGGVILSGANTSLAKGESDGIVTGLKLAAMDLSGTELVVLSACETGVGDIQPGEGVAGLNQAFIRAGAKGIVMSLWRVPDKPTAELMTSLYSAMSKGMSPAASLRAAQLRFIKQKVHPLAWAAFVYSG